jgi:hypothetical protein
MRRFFIAYIGLLIIFITLIFVASSIPKFFNETQLQKTYVVIEKEGQYPSFGIEGRKIGLDNFTDSIIVNTSLSIDSKDPLKSSFIALRAVDPQDKLNQIAALKSVVNHNVKEQVGYERYWHGYLFYIRPLLMLFSYSQIRFFLALILYLTFLLLLYNLYKRTGLFVMLCFVIGFIFIDYFYLYKSIQFSGVFIIANLGALYRLTWMKKSEDISLLFFIIGGVTSYIDLLTAPLTTLGMLLLIETQLHKTSLKNILVYSSAWAIGYLSLWSSKWILVQLLYTPGAIQTSIDQIVNRTVTKADPNFNHIETIKRNIFQLIGYDRKSKIAVLGFILIVGSIFLKYHKITLERVKESVPLILISLMPYLWYLVAANHSYLHVWFTYRTQFMAVVGGLLFMRQFIDQKQIQKDFETLFFMRRYFSRSHSRKHQD